MQLSLLAAKAPPPPPPGIDIHCGDIRDTVPQVTDAALVIADPPWVYDAVGVRGNAADEYGGLSHPQIVDVLNICWDSCRDDAYMMMWLTHPQEMEFWRAVVAADAVGKWRWRYLTGGSWHKTGGLGIGFHTRGDSELWLLFAKGKPNPRNHSLSNAWASPRTDHSEKPQGWTQRAIETWTDPGDLVLCPFVGLGVDARAALATGRQFIGAEIDPERHAMAIQRLRQK